MNDQQPPVLSPWVAQRLDLNDDSHMYLAQPEPTLGDAIRADLRAEPSPTELADLQREWSEPR